MTDCLCAIPVLLIVCHSVFAAPAKPVDDVRASAERIHGMLVDLHGEYIGFALRNRRSGADFVIRARVQTSDGTDLLVLDLHVAGDTVIWGAAWSPGKNWRHRLEVSGLQTRKTSSGMAIEGPVTVHMSDPMELGGGRPATVASLTLGLQVFKTRVGGKFTAERMKILKFKDSGRVTGEYMKPGKDVNAAMRKVSLAGLNSYSMYRLVQAWEVQALHLYRQVRAIEHARLAKLRVPDVIGEHIVHVPARPSFSKKPVSGQDGKQGKSGKQGKQAKPRKPKVAVPIDDMGLDDDLGLGEDVGGDGIGEAIGEIGRATAEDKPETVRKRTDVVKEIARHLEMMVAAVVNQRTLRAKPGSFVHGAMSTDDPDFGPWYGFEPLPQRKGKHNVVPSGSGGPGVQHWPYLSHWQALGPFRQPARVNLHMPDVIRTTPAIYDVMPVNETKMSGTKVAATLHTPDKSPWRDKFMHPDSCMLRPWNLTIHGGHQIAKTGRPGATCYFATTIWADEPCELWAGGLADDAAILWVNERLVCSWPGPDAGQTEEHPTLFKLKLRKGENRIMLRHDQDEGTGAISLRVCLRGTPRPGAEARAHAAAVDKQLRELAKKDAGISGWRNRSDGRYPDATPPLAWDRNSRDNIRWRSPAGGKSPVIIVGDKLFAAVPPFFVACLDKNTGKELWRKDMNVLELTDKAKYTESLVLEKVWADLRDRAYKARESGEGNADALRKESHGAYKKWWKFLIENGKFQKGSMWNNFVSHMFATPVTDGKHLWVKCAADTLACFDLDGNRRWMVRTPYGDDGFSFCTSPVLVDGKLILELPTGGESWCESQIKMVCFDAATGKELWEVPRVYNLQPASTPAPLRLGNGKESMAVIVTGGGSKGGEDRKDKDDLNDVVILGGTVVRVDDGKVLIKNLGTHSGWSSPNPPGPAGDRLFHVGCAYGTCTRFVMASRDVIGAQRVWMQTMPGCDGGMVYHDGILYGVLGGQWPRGVGLFDAATGEATTKKVNLNTSYWKFGRGYTPPSFAGGYLFMQDDGTGFGWSPHDTKVRVIQPGPEGRLLSRNKLERGMMAPLVFDGDRIYARSSASIMCIAHTGESGKKYEAETVAATLLEDLTAEKPTLVKAISVKAVHGSRNDSYTRLPVAKEGWNVVGPYPASDADAILAALGGARLTKIGRDMKFKGKQLKKAHITRHSKTQIRTSSGNRSVMDLARGPWKQPDSVSYYYHFVGVKKERTVRVYSDQPKAELWISGAKVRHQDRVTLEPGRHVLLLKVVLRDPVPERLLLDMRLYDSPDAKEDVAFWRRSIERNRRHLERVIQLSPDSRAAQGAKKVLAALR